MSHEHLVQMANDIGHFFQAEPDHEEAIAGMVNHLTRFWTPRMRKQILEVLAAGGGGLEELPAAAVRRLAAPAVAP
jgi:formate dehydrogenase subunit delta